MRRVIELAAIAFCLTMAPAFAAEQAPNDAVLEGSKTHDIRVTVHNNADISIYAALSGNNTCSDWMGPVDPGDSIDVKWQITGCPTNEEQVCLNNSDDGDILDVDVIGGGIYNYKNEQNGCHLKSDSVYVNSDYEDKYKAKDENNSNSEHDRKLYIELVN